MINVFVLQNGRLNQVPIESRTDLENVAPIWVDMTDPTEEERSWVKSTYDVTMPDEDDVKDIEASARYYEAENGDLHLRTECHLAPGTIVNLTVRLKTIVGEAIADASVHNPQKETL